MLTIDGAKLRPDGFGPGEKTAMIGILAGSHRFEAVSPNVKPAQAPIVIQPNSSATVIACTKVAPDALGGQPSEKIELFVRPNSSSKGGKQFAVIYASKRPSIDVVLNGTPTSLTAFREVPAQALKVEHGGKAILAFTARENGSFLAVLFDKPDGELGGVVLPDYR